MDVDDNMNDNEGSYSDGLGYEVNPSMRSTTSSNDIFRSPEGNQKYRQDYPMK